MQGEDKRSEDVVTCQGIDDEVLYSPMIRVLNAIVVGWLVE
jgi:hypothetical protein